MIHNEVAKKVYACTRHIVVPARVTGVKQHVTFNLPVILHEYNLCKSRCTESASCVYRCVQSEKPKSDIKYNNITVFYDRT